MKYLTWMIVFVGVLCSTQMAQARKKPEAHDHEPERNLVRVDEKLKNKAQAHYLAGKRHYDAGLYEQALAEFELANSIYFAPSFFYNIAWAHIKLGHKREAVVALRSYAVSEREENPVLADQAEQMAEVIEGFLVVSGPGELLDLASEEWRLAQQAKGTSPELGERLEAISRRMSEIARVSLAAQSKEVPKPAEPTAKVETKPVGDSAKPDKAVENKPAESVHGATAPSPPVVEPPKPTVAATRPVVRPAFTGPPVVNQPSLHAPVTSLVDAPSPVNNRTPSKASIRKLHLQRAGYALLAIGLGAGGAGGIMWGDAIFGKVPDIQQTCMGNCNQDPRIDSAHQQYNAGVGLSVGGAVVAAVGAVLAIVAR